MSQNFPLIIYIIMIFVSLGLDVLVKDIHFLITRTHYKEHHFVVGRYVFVIIS